MSGIFGILNENKVTNPLLQKLQQQSENAAHHCVSVATVTSKRIEWQQTEDLHRLLQELSIGGRFGIVYTHEARMSESDVDVRHASFYATEHIAVVHSGVIENHDELREELINLGYEFEGKTDSEVILRLISRYLDIGLSPKEAISVTIMRLCGFFALITLFAGEHEQLIAARRGIPLAIGVGEECFYVSSDVSSLKPFSRQIMRLEDSCPVVLSSVKTEVSNV
jgi:glucosamine--fructose-6-phosphate aminotransferase (isomerizing)